MFTFTGHLVTSVSDQANAPIERGRAQKSGSNPHTGPANKSC
uniref:Mobile element protein n=1 Tax=Schistosoma curassoni TaxID=6186 RepID=A0A183KSE2_9TREM